MFQLKGYIGGGSSSTSFNKGREGSVLGEGFTPPVSRFLPGGSKSKGLIEWVVIRSVTSLLSNVYSQLEFYSSNKSSQTSRSRDELLSLFGL